MTLTTLEPRQDHTPDLAADTIARMLDIGDHISADPHEQRLGWVSVFVADARLLARLVPDSRAWVEDPGPADDLRAGRTLLQDIADRLWMVCASPEEAIHSPRCPR